MTLVPGRLKVILLFIIGAIIVMFIDGLVFDNYNAKPSMALGHGHSETMLYEETSPAQPTDTPSDPDQSMGMSTITENGQEIKVMRISVTNVEHEIRPGVIVPMFAFNERIPGPTIRVDEGDRVRVIFTNSGTDPHTIHWHGINDLDTKDDGVPGLGQPWVMPGEEYVYEFTASPAGTKMYHCHVEAPHHIQMGMFGALIVTPKAEDSMPFGPADKEHIVIFSEYESAHVHTEGPTDEVAGPDSSIPWITPGPKGPHMFQPMLDEFMINGKSFPAVPPFNVQEGDVVRWRLINLGLNVHSLHIHGHHFTVTHRDGFPLDNPFEVDTLLIGPGERYDVWFEANNPGLWVAHDHAGLNIQAKGYDPAGIITLIKYEGISTEAFADLSTWISTYNRLIPELASAGSGGGHHEEAAPAGGDGHSDHAH